MAITGIDEIWKGETTSDQPDGARDYTRHFRIYSDSVSESPVTVRMAMPSGTHPDDASAYPIKRTANRIDESRLVWEGQIDYEFKKQDPGEDPVSRAPRVKWTSSLVLVPVLRDLYGRPCVNSAGDYFDPPLETPRGRLIALVRFNASSPPVGLLSYNMAVNNSPISIDGVDIAAERAQVSGIDIGEVEGDAPDEFREVTFQVECRDADDEGYDQYPIDQGFRTRATSNKTGTVTTRTDDLHGILTMAGGHGIVKGQTIDLYWDSGASFATGFFVEDVTGNAITISSRVLDLPPISEAVTIPAGAQKDILITDTDGNKARPSSPVFLNGNGQVLEAAGAVFLEYIVTRKLDLTVFPGITG
jgi:hypothetical protein